LRGLWEELCGWDAIVGKGIREGVTVREELKLFGW
jgi:hypothetical protein